MLFGGCAFNFTCVSGFESRPGQMCLCERKTFWDKNGTYQPGDRRASEVLEQHPPHQSLLNFTKSQRMGERKLDFENFLLPPTAVLLGITFLTSSRPVTIFNWFHSNAFLSELLL